MPLEPSTQCPNCGRTLRIWHDIEGIRVRCSGAEHCKYYKFFGVSALIRLVIDNYSFGR